MKMADTNAKYSFPQIKEDGELLDDHHSSLLEERRFQELALAEAERLFRTGGKASDLAHVPILKDAVAAIMRADSRARQLGLFED